MTQFFHGLVLSFAIASLAYKKKSLSVSGLIAATIYGTGLYSFGGLFFFIVMISFFLSSSLLSRYKNREKKVFDDIYEKGGKRDYTQVIANGLPSFIFAYLFYLTQNPTFALGLGTSLAAANADTWASELGVLSKKNPVSIITGKPLSKGMSGGVTAFGTLASFLGALFISIIFTLGYNLGAFPTTSLFIIFILCLIGGFLGSLIDSFLGATVQGIFYDQSRGLLTEKKVSVEAENKLVKGHKLISNNIVNFLSVSISAIIVMIIYTILTDLSFYCKLVNN